MSKILLADDEDNLREAVTIILQRAGYEVVVAADGTQAVERFVRERPDLVILDVMMPWMDGYQACERIRVISPDVPVLMLTAKGDIVDKKIGFHAGADDYMVKPFNDEELLLRVEALLRRRGRGESSAPSAIGQVVTVGGYDHRSAPLRGGRGGQSGGPHAQGVPNCGDHGRKPRQGVHAGRPHRAGVGPRLRRGRH